MQPSPLEILFYYVEALRWKVESDFDPEAPAPLQSDDIEWHLQREDDEGKLREAAYRLSLSLPPCKGRFAYSFEIVVVGYFRLSDSVPDEQVVRVLDANAPALLYGVARETLATSVGRGPFRPLMLPTVHFQGLQREEASDSGAETPRRPIRKSSSRKGETALAKLDEAAPRKTVTRKATVRRTAKKS